MKKKEKSDKSMPFTEHLEELRWVLFKSLLSIMVFFVISFYFSEYIMDFLLKPLPETSNKLIYLEPAGGFMVRLKAAFSAGIVFSLPVIVYQLWSFIAPGLIDRERRYVPAVVFFTTICFAAGASFAYFGVIPLALAFFEKFQTDFIISNITINSYLSFVVWLMLVFGLVFELPVLALFFAKIGLVNDRILRKARRYAIVIIVILAAILTPPDVVSQIMLAIPLILLYEVSIIIAKIFGKKKEDEE